MAIRSTSDPRVGWEQRWRMNYADPSSMGRGTPMRPVGRGTPMRPVPPRGTPMRPVPSPKPNPKPYVPGYGYVTPGPGTSGSVLPGPKPYDSGQRPFTPVTGTSTSGGGGGGSWGGGNVGSDGTLKYGNGPVRTTVNIDVTPNKKVGTPAGVKAAEADKVAALAALAAQQRREEIALRDQYSQNLMAAQSSAADVYGGRSPAIFGQAATGARRQFISGRSGQVQESIAERAALRRTYDEAIRQAYVAAAQQAQQDAYNRAQMALMASQTMGY